MRYSDEVQCWWRRLFTYAPACCTNRWDVSTGLNEGCKFYGRCPHAMTRCTASPPNYAVGEQQYAACYRYADGVA